MMNKSKRDRKAKEVDDKQSIESMEVDGQNNNSRKSEELDNTTIYERLIVISGCYEKALFGYSVNNNKFTTIFNNVSHEGCIKSVSASGKYLASSSTDETIK
jgi:hypothetical protein